MASADILIAEDDRTLRNVYEKKFSIAGYAVRTVHDGAEALKAIGEKAPDLLILDINMPVLDGFAVLRKVNETNPPPYPVIMLTNFADEDTKKKGKELGADDYFVKSDMTLRTLLQMVKTLLDARKYFK